MTTPLGSKPLRNVRPVPKIGKLLWVHFLYLNQWLHQLQCSALKLRIPISMKGQ